MAFKAGDWVVHTSHGVGKIEKLEERQLAEEEPRLYYVITVDVNKIWLPVNEHGHSRLRKLTAKSNLARYRRLLKSQPEPLEEDHQKRQKKIAERLKQGSFKVLCEVVRDLTAHGWERHLTGADSTLLDEIRTGLSQEWATVLSVPLADALDEVESLLKAGQEAHMAS